MTFNFQVRSIVKSEITQISSRVNFEHRFVFHCANNESRSRSKNKRTLIRRRNKKTRRRRKVSENRRSTGSALNDEPRSTEGSRWSHKSRLTCAPRVWVQGLCASAPRELFPEQISRVASGINRHAEGLRASSTSLKPRLLSSSSLFLFGSSPFTTLHPSFLLSSSPWQIVGGREERPGRPVGLHKRYHLSIVVTVARWLFSRSLFNRPDFYSAYRRPRRRRATYKI